MIDPTLTISAIAGPLIVALGVLLYSERRKLRRVTTELASVTESEAKGKATIATLLSDLEKLRNRLGRKNDREVAQASQVSELENQLELLAKKLEDSNEATAVAHALSSSLQAQIASAQDRINLEVAKTESVKQDLRRMITLGQERGQIRAELEQQLSESKSLVDTLRRQCNSLSTSWTVAQQLADSRQVELDALKTQVVQLREHTDAFEEVSRLKEWLAAHETDHELVASGLYSLSLDIGSPDSLRRELEDVRQNLAQMISEKTAVTCDGRWQINGSYTEGARATKHYTRIMLRTFNADADACLDLVRWNNLEKCISRLRASFEYVNELGSTHITRLQEPYLEARIKQLKIMHRYKEAIHRQKESVRATRAAEAEERRANREIERARAEAEIEERRYSRALERAREEATFLLGNERDKMLQIVADLEKKLAAASALKQRAISMAQITKAGFVYVVSNIGSFGADVLKIGMTRRIDPQERVRELGGASVPFHFDVHAMIYSENAPALENSFHRRFARQRINLANGRKEFFRVALPEVVRFAEELSLAAEFSTVPEARDYHLSSALRSQLLSTLTDEEINSQLDAMLRDETTSDIDEDPNELNIH